MDVVLDFPKPIQPVRQVRSTVLLGSVQSIRDGGYFDAYVAALTPAHRESLLGVIAGMWMSIDVARAHYAACDALALPLESQLQLGRATFERTKGTLLGTTVRMAQHAGATPWTIFPFFQRIWLRGYDGGGVRILKVGPKEAQVELVANELLEFPYHRNALRGLVTVIVGMFCQRAYMSERPPRRASEITYRAQWV